MGFYFYSHLSQRFEEKYKAACVLKRQHTKIIILLKKHSLINTSMHTSINLIFIIYRYIKIEFDTSFLFNQQSDFCLSKIKSSLLFFEQSKDLSKLVIISLVPLSGV